ncbi:MAG TPA: NYN domain-containing protein [bacterium]|nr:NYN domain-containing protein [bacterium]HOL35826.1 NYN domain-containing protein [bacterium]HPP07885.1 NYN domain-containing protein [bacterium]
MHYILDGNNIIKHRLWNQGKQIFDDRLSLIISLKEYCNQHPSVKFTVVFDGWTSISSSHPGIKIIWSDDESADSVIIRKLACADKTSIIVSNDNQIRNRAKFAGFKILKVEEFLAILEKRKNEKKSKSIDSKEKKISYNRVPQIQKELEEYYESHYQETEYIRKFRKRHKKFF